MTRALYCCEEVYPESKGRGGLAPSHAIRAGCGRPAKVLFRGLVTRRDGTLRFGDWRTRCGVHHQAYDRWHLWIVKEHPEFACAEFVRPL